MQKRMDVSRLLAMGWQPRIDLRTGLQSTYQWYLEQSALRR
jgi:GDP-L-fucose synthase